MANIENVVNFTNKKIVELEARKEINVTMRIDEVIPMLQYIYADLTDEKFALIKNATNCSIVVKSGDTVLTDSVTYGDTITITATPDTGYNLKSLKVNGEDFENGGTLVVGGTVTITAVAEIKTFSITATETNCTLTILVNNEIAGDTCEYGDTIKVSASVETGYEMTQLTVNGNPISSGDTFTATEDIVIVGVAALQTFKVTITADENSTVTVVNGDDEQISSGDYVPYGTMLMILAEPSEGYEMASLSINGVVQDNPYTATVASVTQSITIVATSQVSVE